MSGYDTLNFGYIPSEDSEIASFLRNTGGLVNIRDSSLPPTPGQILTAIDANNASWANLAEVQAWKNTLAIDNSSGTNDVVILQKLEMPNGAATNTTALFNVTSGAGVPTSVGVRPGSLYFDDTANQLWIYDGAAWTNSFTSPTWAQVLLAGNTSGATNPTIDAAQQIIFTGDIMVGGTGIAASTAGTNNVVMGRGAVNLGSSNTIMGRLAKVNFATDNNVVVGDSALIQTDGAESTALGFSATCGGADGLGNRTALGANAVCNAYNGLAAGNAATVLAGHHDSVALGTNAITSKANEIMLGVNTGFVTVPGTLEMSLTQPQNTLRLLNITTSDLGPPTSTALGGVREGSLYHDKLNSNMYMFSNGAWILINIPATPPTPTPNLAAVLAVGNNAGTHSIQINTGYSLEFVGGPGTIQNTSGDISMAMAIGSRLIVNRSLFVANQTGGILSSVSSQTIPQGAALTTVVFDSQVYGFDYAGRPTTSQVLGRVWTYEPSRIYSVNVSLFCRGSAGNIIPRNIYATLYQNDGGGGGDLSVCSGSNYLIVSATNSKTRFVINISAHVYTTASATGYVFVNIANPGIGSDVFVDSARLSAILMN